MAEQKGESLKYKTKKGIYWTFFNQMALNGMHFVVGIVMARLLSPSDYGITALPAIFMSIAGTLMSAGFSTALVRKPEVSEEDLATSFYYSIGMGILMYVCLFFASPWIAVFYETPVLTPLIRVTALTFLWSPLSTPQSVILNRRLDFKTPARISIVNSVVSAIVGISIAYAGYGLWALVASGLCSSVFGLILTWWAVKWLPRARWSKESFNYLWGFGNKLMASSLIQIVYVNIPAIILGKFYSPAALGVYNRARGYARLPVDQMSGIVQSVTFPVLSQAQKDDDQLNRVYRTIIRAIAFISFPVLFMMIALAKPLIIVFITEKWIDCVLLLQLICFYMMWAPVSWMNLNVLQVKGRSDLFLKLDVQKKIVGFVLMCVFLPFGLTAFCFGLIVNQVYVMYVNIKMTEKVISLTLWQQLKDVRKSYALAFLMCVVVYTTTLVIPNYLLQLIIGGTLGVLIYVGGAFLFRFEELDTVKYMISRKQK